VIYALPNPNASLMDNLAGLYALIAIAIVVLIWRAIRKRQK